jgi:PDZ domain
VVLGIPSSTSFTTVSSSRTLLHQQGLLASSGSGSTALYGIAVDDVQDFGFSVSVNKPLGVIFGENRDPYLGLRVDDVALDSEGSRAGLRVGDQLLAVNAVVTIGQSFDSAMTVLQESKTKMTLTLYRGTVRELYAILRNRDLQVDDEEEGEEEVIMDENYESPVVVEFTEDPGFDVMKAFAKLTGGGGAKKSSSEDYQQPEQEPKQEKKKGGGLFGMFGEAVQLEGDDATGIKR